MPRVPALRRGRGAGAWAMGRAGRGRVVGMSDLPRLTTEQQALVQTWLPEYELVADLSWGQMDTAVLHLRTAKGDRIVKSGGAENHHIERAVAAHLGFTRPWVEQGRAARLVRHDDDNHMLLRDYLPGVLMQETAAEGDPAVYRQAGR